ncbi:MAG: phospholipase D-like domain-containing protein, partial [Microlunatus sp.]
AARAAKARVTATSRAAVAAKARATAAAKAAATAKARAATIAKSKATKQQKAAAKASAKAAATAAKKAAKASTAASKAYVRASKAYTKAQATATARTQAAKTARLVYVGYAKQRAQLLASAAKTAKAKATATSKAAASAKARYKAAAKVTSAARKKLIAANKAAAPYRKKIAAAAASAKAAKAAYSASKVALKAAKAELKAAKKAKKKAKKKNRPAALARLRVATQRVAVTNAAVAATKARTAAAGKVYVAAVNAGRPTNTAAAAATSAYQSAAKRSAAARAVSVRATATAKAAKKASDAAAKRASNAKKAAGPNSSWSPKDFMVFNNPKGSKAKRYRIITAFNKAVDSVPAGGQIRMAMYLFDIKSVANSLIKADKRGVSVQIIIDGEESNKWIRKVKRALGKNKKSRSFVATCKHSCLSNSQAVIHAKFYTFSVAGQRKYVSIISSANPYTGNTSLSWNNAHAIVGDKIIFDSLNQYFTDMLKDKPNRKYWRSTTSGKYTIWMYPQTPKKENDIVWMNALNQVKCKTSKGYGTAKGQTMIRLANWGWSSQRIDIAKKLVELKGKGCNVQVMINRGRITKPVMKALLKNTKYGKVPIYDAWRDGDNDGFASLYVHHKMMTIDGRMGKKDVKITWTGSQNFTGPGTYTNTDIVLRIIDSKVTKAYEENFAYIRGRYTRKVVRMPWSVGRVNKALE